MKLVSEDEIERPTQSEIVQKIKEKSNMKFLRPFKVFQISVTVSIVIHFLKFFYVIAVYYFSDIFLNNPQGTSQPWNSLIYLLAMMIEIIKFIGDCTLRNLLKKEEVRLIQLHKIKKQGQQLSQNTQNIQLKGGQYEDYLSLFNLVTIFKFKHKNYSTAFLMSKQLHLVCTFLLFSWMSFREQTTQNAGWVEFFSLGTFLYSIYFTSFEMDLFMLEISQGKYVCQQKSQALNLTQNEVKKVHQQFMDWRDQYQIFPIFGLMAFIIATIFQFFYSLLTIGCIIILIMIFIQIKMEDKIKLQSRDVIKLMKRESINTYSVLNKSTKKFRFRFKLFVMQISQKFRIERAVTVWLCFLFASDINLNWWSFAFYGNFLLHFLAFGIILLIFGQMKKFQIGNQLKLLAIQESSYPQQYETNIQNECAICLNPFQSDQKVKILPCSKDHIYHSGCFDDWKKIKKQCPLCRYSLQEYL